MEEGISLIYWHTDWLYIKILENKLFFLDFWFFVYFWNGFMLFTFLTAVKSKPKWIWFVFILLLFELIEILLLYSGLNIFKPETRNDQFADLIVGFSGAIASFYFLKSKIISPDSVICKRLLAIISSITLSFLWVGFYQYHYNVNLNTPGLNMWAFSLWTLGGLAFFEGSWKVKSKVENIYLRVLSIWGIYLVILFSIEYLAYNILNIRENSISGGKPLAFGLIHGTRILHVYYITFPFIAFLFYQLMTLVFKKASYELKRKSMISGFLPASH